MNEKISYEIFLKRGREIFIFYCIAMLFYLFAIITYLLSGFQVHILVFAAITLIFAVQQDISHKFNYVNFRLSYIEDKINEEKKK